MNEMKENDTIIVFILNNFDNEINKTSRYIQILDGYNINLHNANNKL